MLFQFRPGQIFSNIVLIDGSTRHRQKRRGLFFSDGRRTNYGGWTNYENAATFGGSYNQIEQEEHIIYQRPSSIASF
jgi:hypothetical protein